MNGSAPPLELALICDAANRVSRVLHASAGCPVLPCVAFAELFDPDSRAKALHFLAAVRSERAAFDWELNVRLGAAVRLFHCFGASADEGVLVVGSESRDGAGQLLRQLLHGHGVAPAGDPASQRTLDPYDALAKLNNELVNSRRELERAHAELRRVAEERSKLAAMAAHDLRNPLGVVQLSAMALRKVLRVQPNSDAGRLLTAITSNAERMVALINDLLGAFTSDLNAVELELASVDIEDLVRANVHANALLAAEKQIGIRLNVSGTSQRIEADPLRLHQVFDNLIHNAIKFSPRGSQIDVSLTGSPVEVVVAVEDRGTGIDPRRIEALLAGKAGTAKGTERESGFGLGLAIAKAIVEKHGGSLGVASPPPSGSRFEVRLPVRQRG